MFARRVTRAALACAIALTASALGASPALAWSNGVDGPNAHGTHDWILDHALDALGDRADWVCRRAALRATDDPDTVDGIDHASGTWWHVWDEWGETWGGAPEAARVWFDRTQSRLEAGRECSASRSLGIMSHFVADVAQPMHTDGSLDAEDRVHSAYESAVDSRSEAADDEYGFDFDGIDEASPRARTLRVARQAHRFYEVLVETYDEHGYNGGAPHLHVRVVVRYRVAGSPGRTTPAHGVVGLTVRPRDARHACRGSSSDRSGGVTVRSRERTLDRPASTAVAKARASGRSDDRKRRPGA